MVDIISPESLNEINPERLAFRWVYIILPVILLIIAGIIAAIFYGQLSADVAYHFVNGTGDRWLGREAITAWMVIPHAVCVLLSFIIVRTVLASTSHFPVEGTPIKSIIPVMGNMAALLQVILVFAELDIFLYNIYEIKLMPLWLFSLIFLVLAAAALGVFFIMIIRRTSRPHDNSPRE